MAPHFLDCLMIKAVNVLNSFNARCFLWEILKAYFNSPLLTWCRRVDIFRNSMYVSTWLWFLGGWKQLLRHKLNLEMEKTESVGSRVLCSILGRLEKCALSCICQKKQCKFSDCVNFLRCGVGQKKSPLLRKGICVGARSFFFCPQYTHNTLGSALYSSCPQHISIHSWLERYSSLICAALRMCDETLSPNVCATHT